MHKKMEELQISTTWMWIFEEFKADVLVEYFINKTCCWRLHLVASKLPHYTVSEAQEKKTYEGSDLCSLFPHLRWLCLWLAISQPLWSLFFSVDHSSYLRTFTQTLSSTWNVHSHKFPLIPLKLSNLPSESTSIEKPFLSLQSGQVRSA